MQVCDLSTSKSLLSKRWGLQLNPAENMGLCTTKSWFLLRIWDCSDAYKCQKPWKHRYMTLNSGMGYKEHKFIEMWNDYRRTGVYMLAQQNKTAKLQ